MTAWKSTPIPLESGPDETGGLALEAARAKRAVLTPPWQVPVFFTIVVKKLIEGPRVEEVDLVCTVLQRPLVYDLSDV